MKIQYSDTNSKFSICSIFVILTGLVFLGACQLPFEDSGEITVEPLSVPIPTISPETPQLEFSLTTVNNDLPEDIRKQVMFFAGGGGGHQCFSNEQETGPWFYAYSSALGTEKANYVIDSNSHIVACNLLPNEVITFTITKPNGKIVTFQDTAKNIADIDIEYASFFYRTEWDDPSGEYKITVSSPRFSLEESEWWLLEQPKSPVVARSDHHLDVYNLQENEQVQIIAYGPGETFLGWKNYQADSDGRLTVYLDVPESQLEVLEPPDNERYKYRFAVIGKISGEIPYLSSHIAGYMDSAFNQKVTTWGENAINIRDPYLRDQVSFVPGKTTMNLLQISSDGMWASVDISGVSYEWVNVSGWEANNVDGWVRISDITPTKMLMVKNDTNLLIDETSQNCPTKESGLQFPKGFILQLKIARKGMYEVYEKSLAPKYCFRDGNRYWHVAINNGLVGWVNYDDIQIIEN